MNQRPLGYENEDLSTFNKLGSTDTIEKRYWEPLEILTGPQLDPWAIHVFLAKEYTAMRSHLQAQDSDQIWPDTDTPRRRSSEFHRLTSLPCKNVSQSKSLLHGYRKWLRALATAWIGVSGQIRVRSHSQRNVVDLTRSGSEIVGTGPVPGTTAGWVRPKID